MARGPWLFTGVNIYLFLLLSPCFGDNFKKRYFIPMALAWIRFVYSPCLLGWRLLVTCGRWWCSSLIRGFLVLNTYGPGPLVFFTYADE